MVLQKPALCPPEEDNLPDCQLQREGSASGVENIEEIVKQRIQSDELHEESEESVASINRDQEVVEDDDLLLRNDDSDDAPVNRRDLRDRTLLKPPKRHNDYVNIDLFVAEEDDDEPLTYKEVMDSCNSIYWIQAMQEELDSLNKDKVWCLVDKPETQAIIDNR